ncbi:MAG: hypothetical protein DSZ14_04705 [Candidatus Thioglobus sp.]|nr:MAG: hypothetical protein DSZ14_04705 [Candidatus Thioglobus sp.]
MKAVIFAGGFGTRLSESTHLIPKPMVTIGDKPILWHIMKIYSHYGINEFIICGGYKQYVIKEYFANYFRHNCDMTVDLADNSIEIHENRSEKWKVTMVDTGLHYKKWTRQQAIDYMAQTTGTVKSDVVAEIERYMIWPAQALGYKLGMLNILRLREKARQQLGNDAMIGVSCYNDIELAKTAQSQGADYVAFGALFSSQTKPNAPQCPLDVITQAKQVITIPIVCIGGIDFSNQHQAFDAGCDAVAMINALFQSADSPQGNKVHT